MTLQTVLAWSISRSIIMAMVGLPASVLIREQIQRRDTAAWSTKLLTALALLPLFVPELLTGFAYRLTAARLIHNANATELLYAGLLLVRVISLQVLLMLVLPASSVSQQSLHSWKLLPGRTVQWWSQWLRLQFGGPLRTCTIAFLGGVLLSFQEFESAALLQVDQRPITFTVWLFDAHALGDPLSASLYRVSFAVTFQILLLLPAVWLLSSGRSNSVERRLDGTGRPAGYRLSWIPSGLRVAGAWLFVGAGTGALVIWPVVSNAADAFQGLKNIASLGLGLPLLKQIVHSLLPSLVSAVVALSLAWQIDRIRMPWVRFVALLPGLCGALFLGTAMLALFQLPGLNMVYDTYIPMLTGSCLLVLPRAYLLVILLKVSANRSSCHMATLLAQGSSSQAVSGSQLLWVLATRRWLLATAVLTHWCCWDVTIASMLRPVRFEPIVTRLYNEMHYGRAESLVAMTLVALVLPITLYAIVIIMTRKWIAFRSQRRLQSQT